MKGHPFLGAFSGLIFGISLAGLLLATGTLATDSVMHIVLPIVGLILGIVMAAIAPFKRSRLQTAPAAAATAGPAPLADPPAAAPPVADPPAAAPPVADPPAAAPPAADPPAAAPPASSGGRLHADPPTADEPPADGS